MAREQLDEAALGPVVEVAGRVAELLDVRPARHVQAAPQRLARHRHEQVAARDARHLGDRVRRIGHVLEHLDRRRDVELAVGERQVLGLRHLVGEVRRLAPRPLGMQQRVVEVDADDATVAEALRPLVRQHALAAADVEQRRGVRLLEELVERALEGAHQAPHDRVGRAVLVVRVAGDGALGVDRHGGGRGAHSRSAS